MTLQIIRHYCSIIVVIATWPRGHIFAIECYNCEGICHAEQCNCQTNKCVGAYCFSELSRNRRSEQYTVMKGCTNRLPAESVGCYFDELSDQTKCYCNNEKFCNSDINRTSYLTLPTLTCPACADWSAVDTCRSTCQGNYCEMDGITRATTCRRGSLRAPYSLALNEFALRTTFDNTALYGTPGVMCTSLMTGAVDMAYRKCACARQFCLQNASYHGMITTFDRQEMNPQRLHKCYKCQSSLVDRAAIQQCLGQNQFCMGHFCVLSVTTVKYQDSPTPLHTRVAGCLNTSRPEVVMTSGCYQEYVSQYKEVIHCACRSNFCNQDLSLASGALYIAKTQSVACVIRRVICLLIIFHLRSKLL